MTEPNARPCPACGNPDTEPFAIECDACGFLLIEIMEGDEAQEARS